jgi:hypothetical protein
MSKVAAKLPGELNRLRMSALRADGHSGRERAYPAGNSDYAICLPSPGGVRAQVDGEKPSILRRSVGVPWQTMHDRAPLTATSDARA